MERVHYTVLEDKGRWFVKLGGNLHGPYPSQEAAMEDAIRGAQGVPDSIVLLDRGSGEIKAEWTWGDGPPRA